MRYALLTQNKAGTHLCTALLDYLGLERSYIHIIGNGSYVHYDKNNLDGARGFGYKNYLKRAKGIKPILDLVPDNGFFTSHMNPSQAGSNFLEFKKIILTRDLAERKASLKRWKQETGRSAGLRTGLRNWLKQPNTFHLDFQDIIGKNIEKIDELQKFLFEEIKTDSKEAIEKALNFKTITKSSIRAGDNW